ncbi:hypothetical protein CEUSTIGMA_g7520.t1 [Chlamydomonas eustigma]|uniref:HotDog ACOT-type domain-containing protein n=1 Tax=Chlamydomonas eustigma TaxID=1157962 RepID=A0A250XB28_9CHLO|nr:hypothetical protein CEUSTIGMA_g7520.t1 [Chlamydomonas eustigma]|eukprot:GAX80082.1 hypothetical protein CEUSTIGMA_g7520.t1 [Chlamydomonas eustigma]
MLDKILKKLVIGLSVPTKLRLAKASELASLLPYSHPILSTRDRPVEDRGLLLHVGPDTVTDLTDGSEKHPCQSYLRLTYPFSTSPNLKTLYSKGPAIDVAHWLEDMDTFAADVAGRHCDILKADKKLVTALLEHFVWVEGQYDVKHAMCHAMKPQALAGVSIFDQHDALLSGQVTWVGKSSMEVTVELWANPAVNPAIIPASTCALESVPEDVHHSSHVTVPTSSNHHEMNHYSRKVGEHYHNSPQAGTVSPAAVQCEIHVQQQSLLVAVARFIMAARSIDLMRSATVPRLLPQSPLEEARFELGQAGQLARVARRGQGTISSYDSDSEVLPSAAAFNPPPVDQTGTSAVPMSSTRLHRTVTTTVRDVNTCGSTFGGHLLRLGYEHAVAVAEAHAGSPCSLLSANDIAFLTLVPIGAELHLVGEVAMVHGDVLRVYVTASLGPMDPNPALQQAMTSGASRVQAQSFWFTCICTN